MSEIFKRYGVLVIGKAQGPILFLRNQGRIESYQLADEKARRRLIRKSELPTTPGYYKATLLGNYVDGFYAGFRPVTSKALFFDLERRANHEHRAWTRSPGIAGFQEREDASQHAIEARRYEASCLLATLKKLKVTP